MEELKYCKVDDYSSYILLTSNSDIYFLYDEIKKIMSNAQLNKNSILIDLFYRNGFSFNRFVKLYFNKNDDPVLKIVNPRDVPENIKAFSRNYFKVNSTLLKNSTLASNIKNFILSY